MMKRLVFTLILIVVILIAVEEFSISKKELILMPNNKEYHTPKYNPDKSITYNKSYIDLKDELLYARITVGKNTIELIREKKRLVNIVREFDKLKSVITKPIQISKSDKNVESMVVVMWREGTSVSYVIFKIDSIFYYQAGPSMHLKKIPQKLIELLELT